MDAECHRLDREMSERLRERSQASLIFATGEKNCALDLREERERPQRWRLLRGTAAS